MSENMYIYILIKHIAFYIYLLLHQVWFLYFLYFLHFCGFLHSDFVFNKKETCFWYSKIKIQPSQKYIRHKFFRFYQCWWRILISQMSPTSTRPPQMLVWWQINTIPSGFIDVTNFDIENCHRYQDDHFKW